MISVSPILINCKTNLYIVTIIYGLLYYIKQNYRLIDYQIVAYYPSNAYCIVVCLYVDCRCYDKHDLLPPENPLHCKYSNRLQRKIDIQCCVDRDYCNKYFHFNPQIFSEKEEISGKHFLDVF